MGKLVTLTDEEHFDLLIVLAHYNCQLAREIRDLKLIMQRDRRQIDRQCGEKHVQALLSDLQRYQKIYEQLRCARKA